MESLVALYGTLCNSGLLVVSASDWAWESLGSAPAVAPGVSALVFPLGILSEASLSHALLGIHSFFSMRIKMPCSA